MAVPLVPLLIGAAALLFLTTKKTETPAPAPPPPAPVPTPGPSQYQKELAAAMSYQGPASKAMKDGDDAIDQAPDNAAQAYAQAAEYASYGTAHAASAATLADQARHTPGSITKASLANYADRAARQELSNARGAASVGAAQTAAKNAINDLAMAIQAAKEAPTA